MLLKIGNEHCEIRCFYSIGQSMVLMAIPEETMNSNGPVLHSFSLQK